MRKFIALTTMLMVSTTANAALISRNVEDPILASEQVKFQFIDDKPEWETTISRFESSSSNSNSFPFYKENQQAELNAPISGTLTRETRGWTTVSIPASAWLFVSGLLGIIGISRTKEQA